jgi:hypothetical protein
MEVEFDNAQKIFEAAHVGILGNARNKHCGSVGRKKDAPTTPKFMRDCEQKPL